MSDLAKVAAATVNGETISMKQLLHTLKVQGKMGFVDDALRAILISQAAKREGVTASDEELQEAADEYRRWLGLHKASDTHEWLKQNRANVDDLEERIELAIYTEKLKQKVTDGRAAKYLADHRSSFDTATISQLVVRERGLAEELSKQITEQNADFHELARQHSIDARSRPAGGFIGVMKRRDLDPAIQSAVFAAKSGDIVGPVKGEMGYYLFKVENLHQGELTGDTRSEIEDMLFGEWLAEEKQKANLVDQLSPQI